jgi:hypothetical protein
VGRRGCRGVVSGGGVGWSWSLKVVGWSLLSGEGAGVVVVVRGRVVRGGGGRGSLSLLGWLVM